MPESSPDRELIAQFLRQRDETSFRLLYRRHTPALYGLACRLLGHRRDQADDVIQEAWIRATERLASFRGDASFRTWVSAFVVNCCRERLRADRGHYEDVREDERASDCTIELTLDVDRALAKLAPGYRSVFVLHDIEGRTHDEISALLDIEPGTSKSQLSRARCLLRRFLAAKVSS